MPPTRRTALRELLTGDPRVRLVDSVPDLTGYLAAADLVVSMAGYNSVCEILSFGKPAILVPRDPTGELRAQEQLLRTRALCQRGLVRMIHPADLTPRHLLEEVHNSRGALVIRSTWMAFPQWLPS